MKVIWKAMALALCCALLCGVILGCGKSKTEETPMQLRDPVQQPEEREAMTGEETVEALVRHLIAKEFAQASALFAPAPLAQIDSMGGMQPFMEALLFETGEWLQANGPAQEITQSAGVAYYTLEIETQNGPRTAQFSVDADGLIGGFGFVDAVEVEPVHQMPANFLEESVLVDAKAGYPLEGRLVRPRDTSKPVPAVLLVQGSGALDYDETVGANRVFGKLAKGLAERGIATLRYTKRTYAYPEIAQSGAFSVREEYVEDVLAAAKLLGDAQGVDADRVFILGHSQGGMLAPMFLDEGAQAAGMILLAGTPRKFIDILRDQQESLLLYMEQVGETEQIAQYREMQKEWEAQAEAWRNMTEEETKSAGSVYGLGAYYLYVLEEYDAIKTIRSLKKPTLILQGGNDQQVYVDKDFAAYQEKLSDEKYVEMKLYTGLNHIFLPSVATNISDAMAEYNIAADIPAEVLDDIAAWINKQ